LWALILGIRERLARLDRKQTEVKRWTRVT
jgi:hypothetical protein